MGDWTPIPAKLSEAVARAWDAEEAHQMGEPSPWDFGYDAEWEAGRVFLADTALSPGWAASVKPTL